MMSIPVDPTVGNPDPEELLKSLPSNSAVHRAFVGADLQSHSDSTDSIDVAIGQLSPVDLQNVADQIRFVAPRKCYHYRVPSLPQVVGEDLEEQTTTNGFGAQLRAVVELHDRNYAICSVPESGTQAQLSVDDDSRVTTVATFAPRRELLTIRAPDPEIAESCLAAILGHSDLDNQYDVVFDDDRTIRRFEDRYVDAYTRFELDISDRNATASRVTISAGRDESGGSKRDLRKDDISQDILNRSDKIRRSAKARLDMNLPGRYEQVGIRRPSVEIGFTEGFVEFQQFVPEDVFIRLDESVLDCL